jgi:hypothetical protein
MHRWHCGACTPEYCATAFLWGRAGASLFPADRRSIVALRDRVRTAMLERSGSGRLECVESTGLGLFLNTLLIMSISVAATYNHWACAVVADNTIWGVQEAAASRLSRRVVFHVKHEGMCFT